MPRFYVPGRISENSVTITDLQQLHHMQHVLRLQPGAEITVFDAAGVEHQCTLDSIRPEAIILRVRSCNQPPPKSLSLTVACAIPKRGLMDDIIDKLTQLGIDSIIPLETERSVVKLTESGGNRLERWLKIARTAAEQSRRNTLPEITPVRPLKDVLREAPNYDLKLIPTLVGASRPLKEVVQESRPSRILALIGPEGDFSDREVDAALAAGCVPVSLGETTLRVETAAIALVAYLVLTLQSR